MGSAPGCRGTMEGVLPEPWPTETGDCQSPWCWTAMGARVFETHSRVTPDDLEDGDEDGDAEEDSG